MADRVIIFDIKRAFETLRARDIKQMCGRAGRMHGGKEANVHIVLSHEDANIWKEKFQDDSSYEVISTLNNIETFVFHVISQIVRGEIHDEDSFHEWYDRTLDKFQREKRGEKVPEFNEIALELHKIGAAEYDEKTKKIKSRPLGRICANFYFSPYDVKDWFNNIFNLYKKDLLYNDVCQAWALANVTSAKEWDSEILKRNTESLFENVSSRGLKCKNGISARFLAIDCALSGKYPKVELPCYYTVKSDLPRMLSAIESIIKSCKRIWGNLEHFSNTLKLRHKHGVPTRLTSLISLPGIGKTTAKFLCEDFEVYNEKQLLENIDLIRENSSSGVKRSLTRYLKERTQKE